MEIFSSISTLSACFFGEVRVCACYRMMLLEHKQTNVYLTMRDCFAYTFLVDQKYASGLMSDFKSKKLYFSVTAMQSQYQQWPL